MTRYDVVVPTAGRPALARLLEALTGGEGPAPERVFVVDDRRAPDAPLLTGPLAERVTVLRGPGRGPAAARNAGWRAGRAPWVAFLDDDVVPPPGWRTALARDLGGLDAGVAASQGRVEVPLPAGRRPTDWERNVAGLAHARWATADMAYRRTALERAGGFDERFPRAYREDADLGLRVVAAGGRIVRGERVVSHPVGAAPASVSLTKQAGNADDVLMRALHGRGWRERAGAGPGRRPRHLATAAAGLAAAGCALTGHPRAARAAGATWLAGTAELAWARSAPGPRTPRELATMAWTSALMPFAAGGWWLWGWLTLPRRLRAGGPPASRAHAASRSGAQGAGPDRPGARRFERPAAVLFDRDGTLVEDVPYNGDPAHVRPMPGAPAAVRRLRSAGVPTAVVSNQSGIARGLLTPEQVAAVNRRVEELLGPLGPWAFCPHDDADGCGCRKPAPGLILRAAEQLGVAPERCAVIGDIGADVEAARAAGARGVLVPTPRTRAEEVASAPEVAPDLQSAVDLLLGDRP